MAENFTIKWRGREVSRDIEREMSRRVKVAGSLLESQTVRTISKPFRVGGATPSGGQTLQVIRLQIRYNPRRAGLASKPGQPPRADLGRLRQSIFMKMIDRLTAIVGTPLKYGLWLEEGTRNMAARPYLRATFNRMLPQIQRILTKRMP